ncbi:MAG: metallophosphoesterase family protein [Conexivisphaera sp.]
MAGLRVLFVSDVHYRLDLAREDPIRAASFARLKEIVSEEAPDLLLGAGDWDTGFDEEAFAQLTELTYVLTIYGNHENREALMEARNEDGRPVLLPEGGKVDFDGLVIAGISGNVGSGKKWHHKRPEEFESEAASISEGDVDVLITHEPPAEVPFAPENPYGKRVVLRAVRIVRPKLHFSGHVEYPTQLVKYEGIRFLHVDSQPPACEYALGTFEDGELRELRIRRRPIVPLGPAAVARDSPVEGRAQESASRPQNILFKD